MKNNRRGPLQFVASHLYTDHGQYRMRRGNIVRNPEPSFKTHIGRLAFGLLSAANVISNGIFAYQLEKNGYSSDALPFGIISAASLGATALTTYDALHAANLSLPNTVDPYRGQPAPAEELAVSQPAPDPTSL